MTAEFQYMMHLAGCAALGKTPEPPAEAIDWMQVMTFAKEQTVLPLVQYAIKKAPFSIPDEIRQTAISQLNQVTMRAYFRKVGVLQVLKELEKQGIQAAVIKGFAIAKDYAVPDIRVSGDADIYISEKDEEQALRIFEKFGFLYRKREINEKDTVLTHPQYGMVELHVRLFDDFVHDFWHGGKVFEISQPYCRHNTADGSYNTLGLTDHFLFVLEHAMKHFIAEGCSLRMLLDIGVLFFRHAEELDHNRLQEFISWRRYQTAFAIFLSLLENQCGFSFATKTNAEIENCKLIALLEDMENGGVRGMKHEDNNRLKDGMRVYNSAQTEKMGKVQKTVANNRELLLVIFPSMETMKRKYPWLGTCWLLYPAAWLHRLVTKGLKHLFKRDVEIKNWKFAVEENELTPSIGTQRAELFRLLDMM